MKAEGNSRIHDLQVASTRLRHSAVSRWCCWIVVFASAKEVVKLESLLETPCFSQSGNCLAQPLVLPILIMAI